LPCEWPNRDTTRDDGGKPAPIQVKIQLDFSIDCRALTFGGEEGGEVVGHCPLGSRLHVAFAEQVSNATPTQSNARTKM